MPDDMKKITAAFYQAASGSEPVRDWLLDLSREDRQVIGNDIKTVEFGWPIGMPVCRHLEKGIWEVRSDLPSNRISRVLFCICDGEMILLHGFIKKTQKTPPGEIALAVSRRKEMGL